MKLKIIMGLIIIYILALFLWNPPDFCNTDDGDLIIIDVVPGEMWLQEEPEPDSLLDKYLWRFGEENIDWWKI